MKRWLLLFCSIVFLSAQIQAENKVKTITGHVAAMQRFDGYFTFYWDSTAGKIWLEIDKLNEPFLYINYLSAGLGSNDIGLDRGQIGGSRIVQFEKTGPKILLLQPNTRYRAQSENADERKAVEQSFARAVLWGFDIAAQENGRFLVDASDFLLRDAHDISGRLKRQKQGAFKLDRSRSAMNLMRTKNFPQNSEFDVLTTYTGSGAGRYLRSVAPAANAFTVNQHHSFVALPGPGYKMRRFDPRGSFYGLTFADYATPISQPLQKKFISRHRLQKKDPAASLSEAVEPIVYYIDRGAPEPIRSALVEGASWWNQAFSAAGYKNAFQVKILPEDADPMDVRYNVVQWVHRSTRGWSYGSSIVDPRTGEIIKGHVSLGSLRVRQDYLIASALLDAYPDSNAVSPAMEKMALARLRQLAAHEVGHTLGISHNYAASPNNRASVMDYPYPLVKLQENGAIDLSEAYDVGIGAWDKVSIAFGYQDFPANVDEHLALDKILRDAYSRGLRFISDADARPAGSAHPEAHLWDNGKNAVDELQRLMQVRQKTLQNFGLHNIRFGAPLSSLEDVLVPLYLMHRFQLEAASKVLGGMYYQYSLRGSTEIYNKTVPAAEQRRALSALLETLHPENLALPQELLAKIPPTAFGYRRGRENFDSRTGLTFDAFAGVEAAANITLRFLFQPQRATRLVQFHARDEQLPGLNEVLSEIISATLKTRHNSAWFEEIQHVVNHRVLQRLMRLSVDNQASAQVRAIAGHQLDLLKIWLAKQIADRKLARDDKQVNRFAFYKWAHRQIINFQKEPQEFHFSPEIQMPDGSPIGSNSQDFLLNGSLLRIH